MTLLELSAEYRAHAQALDLRLVELRQALEQTRDEGERVLLREARELAVLTQRYYERGYRRNAKYTL